MEEFLNYFDAHYMTPTEKELEKEFKRMEQVDIYENVDRYQETN